MTLVVKTPPTASTSALVTLAKLRFAALRAIARTFLNRRAAYRVAELPDHLLSDIGLKRDDVHEAMNADWREDPTFRMAMLAHRGRDASLRAPRRTD